MRQKQYFSSLLKHMVLNLLRRAPDKRSVRVHRKRLPGMMTSSPGCWLSRRGVHPIALLQAAQSLGYGASWLTGWPAYDPVISALLGVGEHERIIGFVHIGTPKCTLPDRPRPDPAALLSHWEPAA